MSLYSTFLPRWPRWIRVGLVLVVTVLVRPAMAADATGESNRFLFMVDTSAALQPSQASVREAVGNLLLGSLNGRLQEGDTYGLWLVGNGIDTSFPVELWKKKYSVELAARASEHVKKQGFKGQASFARALAEAAGVMQAVGDLTVILISDGETPISGTPFDDLINLKFRELGAAAKKAGKTLNTTLAVRDGEIVGWAISSPESLIQFPVLPPKPKPAPPVVAEAEPAKPVVPAAEPVAKPLPEAVKPRPAPASIIITKETVAQEKRSYLSAATTDTNVVMAPAPVAVAPPPVVAAVTAPPAPAPVTTNVVAPAEATPVVPVAVIKTPPVANPVPASEPPRNNVSALAPAASPAPPAPAPAPPPEPAKFAATPVVPAKAAVEPVKSAGEPAAQPAPVASIVPPVVPETKALAEMTAEEKPAAAISAGVWIVVGVGVALVCVLVGVFISRSRRQESSLISQAIVQERMRAS